jgi:hypothetical protein
MQRKVFIPEGLTVNHPFFYIIQHSPSGKLYAGYCSSKRHCNSQTFMTKDGYQTSSKYVRELILECGVESFTIETVCHFENAEDARKFENKFLKMFDAGFNPLFINRHNGGKDFCTIGWTEETRQKQMARKYEPLSEEHKEKIRNSLKGKRFSVEHKNKLSISASGRKLSDTNREKLRLANVGRKHSEETRKKMSESRTGKRRTVEQRKAQSERQIGRKHSEEAKHKMRLAKLGNTDSNV